MEKLRKRINVRLVNNENDFFKHTNRPTHINHEISGKNYVAILETRPVLTLNKLIYIVFTVLELSKWLMTSIRVLLKSTLMLNCYLFT